MHLLVVACTPLLYSAALVQLRKIMTVVVRVTKQAGIDNRLHLPFALKRSDDFGLHTTSNNNIKNNNDRGPSTMVYWVLCTVYRVLEHCIGSWIVDCGLWVLGTTPYP